ncbi:putative short-chain dehydrogenase [Neolentinus lepideus HHB14362 ss-1]|uniref:Putative short-chain dehydrogenase n=1 Tax=Neolentinus lepideus HHB14362 ss-1 TaxID=1314782 RepID=A0A165SFL5_9AGAM|nr:putative short-chain dehydrogenase [Neolentinus lepideus HHB14362 ss-1]
MGSQTSRHAPNDIIEPTNATATNTPVAFILGAGPRVGRMVAEKLKAQGYKVAIGSRHPDIDDAQKRGFLPITVDVADSKSIGAAFHAVEEQLGAPPSVVIHNVSNNPSEGLPDVNDPLSLAYPDFISSVAIGAGVFAAAREALAGFRAMKDSDLPKVFITTGNVLPFKPVRPFFATLACQKKVSAHVMELCALTYAKEGFRFYFASQVNALGGLPGEEFNGEAHALAYWDIITLKEQGRWDYRFTKDGVMLPNY